MTCQAKPCIRRLLWTSTCAASLASRSARRCICPRKRRMCSQDISRPSRLETINRPCLFWRTSMGSDGLACPGVSNSCATTMQHTGFRNHQTLVSNSKNQAFVFVCPVDVSLRKWSLKGSTRSNNPVICLFSTLLPRFTRLFILPLWLHFDQSWFNCVYS